MSAHNITQTSSTLTRFQIVGGRRTEDDDDDETFGSVRTPLIWEGAKDRAKIGGLVSRPIEFPVKRYIGIYIIKGNAVIFLVMECDSP